MNRSASYVHALTGRLRIKIPEIKGNPIKAQEIEKHFDLLTGMQQVSANPVTGSLLLIYDPRLLKQGEIMAVLKELGYFHDLAGRPAASGGSVSRDEGVVGKVSTIVASGLMEAVLTQLVSALI
ncbi:MAG: hypothetical protein P8168_08160 [Deltaproteobacteria bacterium]|jgi:hypothetical protein